jgi:two-component system, OmpR family, sensor histidine kinase KdpD
VQRLGWGPQQRRAVGLAALEVAASVIVASGLVALLKPISPITGLGVLYLPAVLFVAVRRGQVAALAAALTGVLAFNFFFIPPLHRFAIARSEDLVALVVLLIAAVVVGRLATIARDRAAEARRRELAARARERESRILAAAAASVLAGTDLGARLEQIAATVSSSAQGSLRLGLTSTPSARPGERALPVPSEALPAWLYAAEAEWRRDELERFATPLASLLDVAVAGARAAERAAEAEAMSRADAAKTAVLHAISHDLRSPLTGIRTAASGIRGADEPETVDELVEVIEAESSRLARLVDDLLDLSRIEAGAVEPRPDWCDLTEVVGRAADQVQGRHGARPVELELPSDLPLIQADPAQLERVFANLLDNAVRFSPPGSPVRVTGGAGAGKVTVRVIDRGPGVPTSQREGVFEPFFRGRRGAGQGSGLGLAICRGFVEANGGEISLQDGTGGGTAFAVRFPLVEQPLAVP